MAMVVLERRAKRQKDLTPRRRSESGLNKRNGESNTVLEEPVVSKQALVLKTFVLCDGSFKL